MCRSNHPSICFLLCKWSALSSCWNKLVLWSLQRSSEELKSLIAVCVQYQSPGKTFLKVSIRWHMHLQAMKNKGTPIHHKILYLKCQFPWNSKSFHRSISDSTGISKIVNGCLKTQRCAPLQLNTIFQIQNYFYSSMKRAFKLWMTNWLRLSYYDIVIPSHPLNVITFSSQFTLPRSAVCSAVWIASYTFQPKITRLV